MLKEHLEWSDDRTVIINDNLGNVTALAKEISKISMRLNIKALTNYISVSYRRYNTQYSMIIYFSLDQTRVFVPKTSVYDEIDDRLIERNQHFTVKYEPGDTLAKRAVSCLFGPNQEIKKYPKGYIKQSSRLCDIIIRAEN